MIDFNRPLQMKDLSKRDRYKPSVVGEFIHPRNGETFKLVMIYNTRDEIISEIIPVNLTGDHYLIENAPKIVKGGWLAIEKETGVVTLRADKSLFPDRPSFFGDKYILHLLPDTEVR